MNSVYTRRSIINENYVSKKTKKDLRSLFDYLERRNFENFPKILDINDRELKTEYIKDINIKDKSKALMEVVSLLHYKTSEYKDVSKNKYKEIYEKISDNIEYLTNYYNKLITNIERKTYFSPSEYLVARHFSIILSSLSYSKKELDLWYEIVESKTKERVVIVHNNLKKEHLLRGEKDYLINWDNYIVDTPVLDLYKFYSNEGFTEDFEELYNIYNNTFNLTKEENKLLFILMSIPKKIEFLTNEIKSSFNIKKILDVLYKTRSLVTSLESQIYVAENTDETKQE
ncbi:MAG: hypothetical protein IJB82_04700 [Bacilli bacterium]|nr:hypothetical protein [Bacilli bacterium]